MQRRRCGLDRDRKIFPFAGAHSTVRSDAFQVAAPPPAITIVRDYDTKPTAIKNSRWKSVESDSEVELSSDIIRAYASLNDRSDLFGPRPTVPGPLNKHARRFSCVNLRPFHDQSAPTAFDVETHSACLHCDVPLRDLLQLQCRYRSKPGYTEHIMHSHTIATRTCRLAFGLWVRMRLPVGASAHRSVRAFFRHRQAASARA
jgi:hypothetical protein